MNAVTRLEAPALHSFHELEQMAAAMAGSGLFGMKTPVQALGLMLVAQAEGQHPATIAQDYDIIQGRAARKSHSVLARFQAAGGKVEWHELSHTKADATFTHPQGGSVRLDWTIEQAKTAKLAGKDNWVGYSRAMLRARVIAEGVRATYPAALGGMLVGEEAQDLPPPTEKHMGPADVVGTPPPPPAPPATYPTAEFDKNLTAWAKAVAGGKKSRDELLAMVQTKGALTDDQLQRLDAAIEKAKPIDATTGEIVMTYAQVANLISKSQSRDKLDEANDLINCVMDEMQRAELRSMSESRATELQ